jgi:putative DNA primase/helicase
LHRALLVIGPPRAGKGTIADVLSNLVGRAAVAAPTLGSLATSFGLQPLIGKRLALVADAHLSGRADEALIVEHLKTITGGDWQSISRKGIGAWHGRLGVRFCIFANEMLNLRDASGALASRFVVLKLTQSFAGREDIRLADQLREELPGILEWALDGLDRLRARQSFRQPRSALDAVGDIQRMGSPVATFVDERCVVSEDASVLCSVLYAEWRQWCAAMGLEPGGANTLSRRLKSACPDIETVKETSGARGLLYRGLRLL